MIYDKKLSFFSFLFTAQEISDIVEMFDGNVRGVQILGNNTCLSLQTSMIDWEDDENLTTAHHRHLRKYAVG